MLKPNSVIWPRATYLQATILSVVSDYISLTKPPIIFLLLVTALGGMFLAAHGTPPVSIMLLLMLGGGLAAGGASAINHYLDRDIDGVMVRTRRRPLPGRRISPGNALIFGLVLNLMAFILLAFWVNLLAASLTLSGTLFYVFVYTLWLKRSTPQNIVIGGAAGSIPPMAGWAAVTGGLEIPALYLFAIIFFWTPPHFWALALLIKDDYARAGIPMLPVVKGVGATRRNILAYTVVVVAISVLFFVTTDVVGWVYLSSVLVLGGLFIGLAWRLVAVGPNTPDLLGTRKARQLYLYSLLYLGLVFMSMILDSVVKV